MSSVTLRFLRELRIASATSNCFPLNEERKSCASKLLEEMPNLTQVGTSVLTLVVIYAKLAHILCAYSSLDVREDGILDSVSRSSEVR
jgi:hypothetical protein